MASKNVPVTITYMKAGLQPPLFVAGSFSDPAWEPQEMGYTKEQDGEHTFQKEIHAEEGSKIQYKFRIGLGDWWVLDEDAPTVTDDLGNRNNIMQVVRHESILNKPGKPAIATWDADNTSQPLESESKEKVESRQNEHKPGLKGPLEALRQGISIPRSETSTPGFVSTAAEVADSAALLDKEEPEPEISNEEAGRLGLRRLSSTPIPDVAKTAAEVADTAQLLDANEDLAVDDVEDPPPPLFAHERLGSAGTAAPEEDREGAPLFAYECVGEYGNDKVPGEGAHSPESHRSPERDYDPEDYDLKDPTLERFPSSREEILERVRSIETGLDEDHTAFDAVPPSPVVGPGRRSSNDFSAEHLSLSPSASPVIPRPSRRLEISRGSFGSPAERSSSVASLHSIVEETAGDDESEGSPSGLLTPERAASPILPDTHTEPEPDGSIPIAILDTGDLETANSLAGQDSTTIVPENAIAASPRIVVHKAQPWETGRDVVPGTKPNGTSPGATNPAAKGAAETDNYQDAEEVPEDLILGDAADPVVKSTITTQDEADRVPEEAPEQDDTTSTSGTARSSALEPGTTAHLKKRTAPADGERTATPTSVHSSGLDAAKNGSWLKAFFRLIFVDWIGGFFRRLLGDRPKAMLTAVAATAILGAVWWKGTAGGSTE